MRSVIPKRRNGVGVVEGVVEKGGAVLEKSLISAPTNGRQLKRKNAGGSKGNNEETCALAKKASVGTRVQSQKSEGKSESILPRNEVKVLRSCNTGLFGGKVREGGDCCPKATGGTSSKLQPYEKIKLQLFPINESTRLSLEKAGYYPFLELILSAKKRICSVIKHINTKWGNENGKLGKALLFPYDVDLEKLASYRRWSLEDTTISAGEVFMSVNCPDAFRLRYGWFSGHQLEGFKLPLISTHSDTRRQAEVNSQALHIETNRIKECIQQHQQQQQQQQQQQLQLLQQEQQRSLKIMECMVENKDLKEVITSDEASDVLKAQMPSVEQVECVGNQLRVDHIHEQLVPWDDNLTNLSVGGLLSEVSLMGRILQRDTEPESQMQPILGLSDISIGGLLSEVSLQGKMNSGGLNSAKELDNQPLSNVNTGCLPSQATLQGENLNPPSQESDMQRTMANENVLQPFSWDEGLTNLSIGGLLSEASMQGKISENKSSLPFYSSIGDSLDACIAAQQNPQPPVSKLPLHESRSSIFDAEDTCHAFPVRKVSPLSGADSSRECHDRVIPISESTAEQPKTNTTPSSQGILDEDSSYLTLKGIKWNDSLGPFDLGQPMWSPLTLGDSVSQFVK